MSGFTTDLCTAASESSDDCAHDPQHGHWVKTEASYLQARAHDDGIIDTIRQRPSSLRQPAQVDRRRPVSLAIIVRHPGRHARGQNTLLQPRMIKTPAFQS